MKNKITSIVSFIRKFFTMRSDIISSIVSEFRKNITDLLTSIQNDPVAVFMVIFVGAWVSVRVATWEEAAKCFTFSYTIGKALQLILYISVTLSFCKSLRATHENEYNNPEVSMLRGTCVGKLLAALFLCVIEFFATGALFSPMIWFAIFVVWFLLNLIHIPIGNKQRGKYISFSSPKAKKNRESRDREALVYIDGTY